MKALQYRTIGQPPEVVEIDTPEPGPGQVRLKVTAAGVCHSDEFIMSLPESDYIYGLPLTLGHEGAGVVDRVGDGVQYVEEGTSMAVYGPWGCGICYECSSGRENYCRNAAKFGITPEMLGQSSHPVLEEGEDLYMMVGDFEDDERNPCNADHRLIEEGYISIVAHNIDCTDYEQTERLRQMF